MRWICFAVAFLAPLLAGGVARADDTAVVLMYHRFGEHEYPSTSIRVEQFRAHLEHLKSAGYTVVPLADVHAALRGMQSLPERAVAITIDDAYLSVYRVAWPMFREFGYPFTVFIATDAVDEGQDALMSWAQMREMAGSGATYANHGAAHASTLYRAPGMSDADWLSAVRADIEKGARRIAEELDLLPGSFAYPYGEYTTAVANQLQDMGYDSFGQHSGAIGPGSDRRALPRFPMAEAFGEIGEFRTKVASLPLAVTAIDPWEPVTTIRQPSITLTLGPDDAQLAALACYVSGQGQVDVNWLQQDLRFSVGPAKSFGPGRRRVNCTAPGNDGRYRWFSHQWIIQTNE